MADPNSSAPPPAYPPYNSPQPYQQFHMEEPTAPEVQHHDSNNLCTGGDGEERQTNERQNEEEELVPGSGPGGVPHKYFKYDFERFFEEDKHTKTFPFVYKAVGLVYKYVKLVLYHILVILIGIPLAVVWAIVNGIMIFVYVWLWGPALRTTIVAIYAVAPAATVPIKAWLGPLFETMGLMLSQIKCRGKFNGLETSKRTVQEV